MVHLHYGDVPAAVASLGAVGALGAALFQIRTERQYRHEREDADRLERHLAQARLISAMVGPQETRGRPDAAGGHAAPSEADDGRTAIYLVNGSDEPVYTLVVSLVFIQGAGPRTTEDLLRYRQSTGAQQVPITTVSMLPGGTSRVWLDGTHWSGILSGRIGAELAFTDRAGSHWVRRATGKLEELPYEPLEYFKEWEMYAPYELQTPERFV
jgi:hypothetical protein